jgi:hypothetical protein
MTRNLPCFVFSFYPEVRPPFVRENEDWAGAAKKHAQLPEHSMASSQHELSTLTPHSCFLSNCET